MDTKEIREHLGKPFLLRLKALGVGISVGRVLGNRVLVKTVEAYTDMDRVEKEGLLYVPEGVKKQYTPPPSTGVVVQVGPDVKELEGGEMIMFSRFAGTDFAVDKDDFKILDVREVMCTLIDTQGVVQPIKEDK